MFIETPIIQTKLNRPTVVDNLIPRPRLWARLNKYRKRPLTLISAPAGYGKTTLVSSWLDSNDYPFGWVSLDEQDDDSTSFLAYFLAALQKIFPEGVDNTMALFNAPELPPIQILTSTLINDLVLINQPFLLVLDDFHAIRNMDILDIVNGLLRYPPPSMHLVLITRKDPPVSLAELRARSRITEIRVHDLRFSEAEVQDYLHLMAQAPLDSKTIKLLTEKSEGWVTGLRLITLSQRHIENIDWHKINHLVNNHMVEDYLMSVILDLQDPAFMDCLLKTAVLERFCAPLCAVVCEPGRESAPPFDGDTFINMLQASNLFIIPLDAQHQWFRYHHLFQDLLLHQLENRYGKEYVLSLHSRAGDWYASNGFIEQALQHFLAAGTPDKAASLVALHRHELMDREQWRRLERWLRQFANSRPEQFPDLLMARAWVAFYLSYDLTETWRILETISGLAAGEFANDVQVGQLNAEVAAIRSQFQWYFADAPAALVSAQYALDNTPLTHECVRSTALIIVGGSLPMSGEFDKGQALIKGYLHDGIFREPSSNARLLMALSFVYWVEGDLNRVLEAGRWLLELGQEHDMGWSTSYAYYFLGIAHLERNEQTRAESYLGYLFESPYLFPMQNVGHSAFPLALLYQANGQEEKAQEVVQLVSDLAFEKRNLTISELIEVFRAEFALQRGQSTAAVNWAQQYEPGEFKMMQRFFIPELTYAKALIAQKTPAAYQEARKFLMQMENHAQAIHNNSSLIKILSLQALLENRQGDKTSATRTLERAVNIGELGGWIRPFAVLGPEMAELLDRLQALGSNTSYLDRILDAFPKTKQAEVKLETHKLGNKALAEPLTARELEVLRLLAQQFSNKEIAAKLVISLGTVGQHTHNIYQKLGVNGRWPAVTKAVELGILQPNNTSQ